MKAPMSIIQDTEPKTEESVANSTCILVVYVSLVMLLVRQRSVDVNQGRMDASGMVG